MKRSGDPCKCPACGSLLDQGAYRCPKCRIYFCFKCRVRVGKGDTQFQCADQTCEYYGKLLCSSCTIMVSEKSVSHEVEVSRFNLKPTVSFWIGLVPGII